MGGIVSSLQIVTRIAGDELQIDKKPLAKLLGDPNANKA